MDTKKVNLYITVFIFLVLIVIGENKWNKKLYFILLVCTITNIIYQVFKIFNKRKNNNE